MVQRSIRKHSANERNTFERTNNIYESAEISASSFINLKYPIARPLSKCTFPGNLTTVLRVKKGYSLTLHPL